MKHANLDESINETADEYLIGGAISKISKLDENEFFSVYEMHLPKPKDKLEYHSQEVRENNSVEEGSNFRKSTSSLSFYRFLKKLKCRGMLRKFRSWNCYA